MKLDQLPQKAALTAKQEYDMEVAKVGLMSSAPFYAYYFYSQMKEYPTTEVPTAATDGRRIFFNPKFMSSLNGQERLFVLAHEVEHAVNRHPQRLKHYTQEGKLRALPLDNPTFQKAGDFVINALLIEERIGTCPLKSYRDASVKGTDLLEDVYERIFRQQGQGQGQGQGDDKDQGFDQVLEPGTDPATGEDDVPGDMEHKEAIAKAAAAAKAMGKLPESLRRRVEKLLEPQVKWQDQLRRAITARGRNLESTYSRPNRRRVVLKPMVLLPGRGRFGVDNVVVAIDTSGSIGGAELARFATECGAVLNDLAPREITLIWCDAKVQRVDHVRMLADLEIAMGNAAGGGGTDFRPVFDWVAKEHMRPELLIYLTDLCGSFPDTKPSYPVVWCATGEGHAPFGKTVRITI